MSMTYDRLQAGLERARVDIVDQAAKQDVPAHANSFAEQYQAIQFAIAYFLSNEDDTREALGEFEDDYDGG